jgi:GntR family transcriptional repressor for pyruvate dehydrogenase complex
MTISGASSMLKTDGTIEQNPAPRGHRAWRSPPESEWKKLKTQTLSAQVTEAILTRIASGQFPADATLPPQRELARELGVALTVVREAIQRLQVLRVVETRHGSGMIVQRLNWSQIVVEPALRVLALEPQMMSDIWDARYGIEKETTLLACRRATGADFEAIEAVLAKASPYPETFERNMELNSEFHLAIARAAGNPILLDLLKSFLEVGFTVTPDIFDEQSAKIIWDTHHRLWNAIRIHDEVEVAHALAHHMDEGKTEIRRVWDYWKLKPAPGPEPKAEDGAARVKRGTGRLAKELADK